MTKKHFIALADRLRIDRNRFTEKAFDLNVEVLADFCQSQNPNFKRDRWIAYIKGECGKNGGKVKLKNALTKVEGE